MCSKYIQCALLWVTEQRKTAEIRIIKTNSIFFFTICEVYHVKRNFVQRTETSEHYNVHLIYRINRIFQVALCFCSNWYPSLTCKTILPDECFCSRQESRVAFLRADLVDFLNFPFRLPANEFKGNAKKFVQVSWCRVHKHYFFLPQSSALYPYCVYSLQICPVLFLHNDFELSVLNAPNVGWFRLWWPKLQVSDLEYKKKNIVRQVKGLWNWTTTTYVANHNRHLEKKIRIIETKI